MAETRPCIAGPHLTAAVVNGSHHPRTTTSEPYVWSLSARDRRLGVCLKRLEDVVPSPEAPVAQVSGVPSIRDVMMKDADQVYWKAISSWDI
jgi:hypothetical protein